MTPAGRFFFHVMAGLAQMERELILERTRAGLEAARLQGRLGGRKRGMTDGKRFRPPESYWQRGTPPLKAPQECLPESEEKKHAVRLQSTRLCLYRFAPNLKVP